MALRAALLADVRVAEPARAAVRHLGAIAVHGAVDALAAVLVADLGVGGTILRRRAARRLGDAGRAGADLAGAAVDVGDASDTEAGVDVADPGERDAVLVAGARRCRSAAAAEADFAGRTIDRLGALGRDDVGNVGSGVRGDVGHAIRDDIGSRVSGDVGRGVGAGVGSYVRTAATRGVRAGGDVGRSVGRPAGDELVLTGTRGCQRHDERGEGDGRGGTAARASAVQHRTESFGRQAVASRHDRPPGTALAVATWQIGVGKRN